jgi:DNA-binding LacI/PurR family transcriptional regulator
MSENKGLGYAAYKEAYDRLGTIQGVAREFGVHNSTVSRSLKLGDKKRDPAIQRAMDAYRHKALVPSMASGIKHQGSRLKMALLQVNLSDDRRRRQRQRSLPSASPIA